VTPAVGFADGAAPITSPCHFALIHYGEEELRAGVLDFLTPAVEDPKQAIYLCGPAGEASHTLAYLAEHAGRDLRTLVAERRIVLGHGDRDADQQLQNLLDPLRELVDRGFSMVRVVGPAAWGAIGYATPEDFLWYESRILPGIEGLEPAAIMCTYDAARLPARALVYGALETHTHTLIDGLLSESPSFMPADAYLKTRLIHLPWLEPVEPQLHPSSGGEDDPGRGQGSQSR
jgi:MEDS: MEthanogen/methylotroph, DcmR Sensory domain